MHLRYSVGVGTQNAGHLTIRPRHDEYAGILALITATIVAPALFHGAESCRQKTHCLYCCTVCSKLKTRMQLSAAAARWLIPSCTKIMHICALAGPHVCGTCEWSIRGTTIASVVFITSNMIVGCICLRCPIRGCVGRFVCVAVGMRWSARSNIVAIEDSLAFVVQAAISCPTETFTSHSSFTGAAAPAAAR